MKKKIFVVFVLIILNVKGQTLTFNSIDSLVSIGRFKKVKLFLENQKNTFLKYEKLAELSEVLDDNERAISFLEKALTLKEEYKVRVKLIKLYKKQKKYEKAIFLEEQILENDKGNQFIAYDLAKLYIKVGKAEKALVLLNFLVLTDDENANYSFYKARAYEVLAKYIKAIKYYKEAFFKDKEHFYAIKELAMYFAGIKAKDSLVFYIDKGLELRPEDIDLNRLKINELFREKKYDESLKLLMKIDSLQPNQHYTNKMIARCYYKLKDFKSARDYFEKALSIEKNDYKIYTYFGDMYFDEEQYDKARLNYYMATQTAKDSRSVEYLKEGEAYEKLKKYKKALNSYRISFEGNKKNYKALYKIAVLNDIIYNKDKKKAYRYYKEYFRKFKLSKAELTRNVSNRMKEIRKYYFKQGVVLK